MNAPNTTDNATDYAMPRNRVFGVPEDRLAGVLLFVAPIFFVANMLTARAVADLIPPVALAFWRWAATFLLLACFVGPRLWARRHDIAREWKDLVVLGALGMGVCGAFVYIGADTTSATNIGLIYSASPVLIILLSGLIYGEPMAPRQLLGVALSLFGVLTIIARGDPHTILSLAFTSGDLWIVAATTGWAVYSVLLRHRPSAMGLMTRFAAIVGAGCLVLAPFAAWEAASGDIPVLTWTTVGTVLFLAVFASFMAYQLYGFIQRSLGASRTSLLMYLIPVYNSALAYLLLDERFAAYHAVGAALVLPGIFLATRPPRGVR